MTAVCCACRRFPGTRNRRAAGRSRCSPAPRPPSPRLAVRPPFGPANPAHSWR
ncbi:hypothetical protein [Lysobacter gummosus]|uniref:hypothetical protein n=1 Tax=Lysobacter gummosus TaxID=262324 RepID=UPI003631B1FD